MSEETEYELNTLCQKLISVLVEHECLAKTRAVYKAFSSTIKKVKKLEYLAFNRFLDDVKLTFSNLKDQDYPLLIEAEKAFAEELNTLISVDYYKSDNESDNSEPIIPKSKKSVSKEKSPKSTSKSKKKTPIKPEKTPIKSEKIKIKLKLTPNKLDSMSMTNFDFDVNGNKVQSLCGTLLKVVCGIDGVQKTFAQLPDMNILPDYYEIIQLPISLSVIKSSINKGLYTSLYHCFTDILIMCLNCKTYNEPNTDIYNMSIEMIDAICNHISHTKISEKSIRTVVSQQLELIDYTPATSKVHCKEDLFIDFWNMFSQVLKKCNKNGRPLASAFLVLPDKDTLPSYYTEIANPLSLAGIRSKIIMSRYSEMEELIADLTRLCDNAIQFNRKASLICKDATNLKDYIEGQARSYLREDTGTSGGGTDSKPLKLGEKRKATAISRDRLSLPGKASSTASPKEKLSPKRVKQRSSMISVPTLVKKEIKKEIDKISPQKVAAVISEEHHSVENHVFACLSELKEAGGGIATELIRNCSSVYKKVDNMGELEDILETTETCRNVLLKIVCAVYSRIDPLCSEYKLIEEVLHKLIDVDKETQQLFECVPTYHYLGKWYFLQEELMTIFRWTPYKNVLVSNSTSITRIAKKKSEILGSVPSLDVLSDDLVLLDHADVKRILITPLAAKLKKPKTPKSECKSESTAKTPKSEAAKTPKSDAIKTPKCDTPKTPKSKTPRSMNPAKTPKGRPKKPSEKTEIKLETEEPVIKKPCLADGKELERIQNAMKSIRLARDTTGKLKFDGFLQIPKSKSYHSIIKYPMSIEVIEQGVEEGTLKTVDDVVGALLLIVQNARYYNEENSELFNSALQLQQFIFESFPGSSETTVLANKVMMDLVEDLRRNTEIEEVTREGNSKFMAMSFSQFCKHVESGFYSRLDGFQDDLLHILVSHLNSSVVGENALKILGVFRYYLQARDKIVSIKSRCFDLTMEKFNNHYQDRVDTMIPSSPMSLITFNNQTYIVGEKVHVVFGEGDEMVLQIRNIHSPCWLEGTVYFSLEDTLFKTDILDLVHIKYVKEKITKRYRYLSYNYRTRTTLDVVTNKSAYSKHHFNSFYRNLTLSKYNSQTMIHGTADNKTYYLQYVRDNGDIFKVGDFVYLTSDDSELPYIARIDKIHKDKKNHVYIYGPWFIRPQDTRFYDNKQYYPNEVLMSSIQDMNYINSIEGRCEILTYKDYTTKHPLSFLEKDVYICESRYDESNHKFGKLNKLYISDMMVSNLEPNEWFLFPSPRKCNKTLKPQFQKPIRVEVESSSEEEESDEESAHSFEGDDRAAQVMGVRSSQPRTVQSVPRHTFHYVTTNKPNPSHVIRQQYRVGPHIARQNLETRISLNTAITNNNNSNLAIIGRNSGFGTQPRNEPHHNNNVSGYRQSAPSYHSAPQPTGKVKLRCKWGSCEESFTSSDDYYAHVINIQGHLNNTNTEWRCRWVGCHDKKARSEGCITQILLRRHLLDHMKDEGYLRSAPAQRPQILRHSEAYKNFLNRLLIRKQIPDEIEMTALED